MARIVGRGPGEALEPEPVEGGLPAGPVQALPSAESERR
jgi:hypothetical protein